MNEENIYGSISTEELEVEISDELNISGQLNIGGGGGSVSKEEVYEIIEEYLEENPVEAVSDYPDLTNKPKINDVELEGNKTLQELGIQPEGDYASIDDIPTKNSQLENDSGYLTEHQDLSSYALKTEIPQVPSWAMQSTKPKYTAAEVGADPAGSAGNALEQANSALSTHNTSTDAHNDIRLFLIDIANRLNALANSDDETLDQMNEVVAYIKDNRELIEQITTNKVNVADIIDNLTTNVSNKPLSAAQGVALKTLFDNLPSWSKEATKPSYTYSEVGAEQSGTAETKVAEHNSSNTAHNDIRQTVADIKVPTKVSELDNDKGYLTEHQSLDGYATESWVEGKGYLTEHQDLSGYATESWVEDKGYLMETQLSDAVETALAEAKASGEFDGEDGYTPIKGTDYWTAADKGSIVSSVIAGLPTGSVTNAVTLNTVQTITGAKTFSASNEFVGEQKLMHDTYCPTVTDIAYGVGASMKNARAVDCQLYVAEIYAPYWPETTTHGGIEEVTGLTAAINRIDFYIITGTQNGQPTGRRLIMQMKEDGLYVLGKKVLTE